MHTSTPAMTPVTPAPCPSSPTWDQRQTTDRPFRVPLGSAEARDAERLVADGALRMLPGGVLVAARAPDDLDLRAAAVRLALAPPGGDGPGAVLADAVVGYETAAWLWAGGRAGEVVDLIIPPGRTRPRGLPVRLHEHRLPASMVRPVCGLRVTDPVRTGADLARWLPEAQVGPALERLGRCGVRPIDLLDRLDVMARQRGVGRARQVVLRWATRRASTIPWPQAGQVRVEEPVIR